jgi:hypothetical protein
MKANELRIGNLVMYSNGGILFKVIGISEFGIDVEDDIETTYMEYENFNPFPLTKELLLKFGFEKRENGHFVKDGIVLYPIRDLYFRGNLFIKADIKYVHQLQNLYFALTGKELTITE